MVWFMESAGGVEPHSIMGAGILRVTASVSTMTVMCEVLEGGNYEVKNVITFYHMNEPQYIRRALQCIW